MPCHTKTFYQTNLQGFCWWDPPWHFDFFCPIPPQQNANQSDKSPNTSLIACLSERPKIFKHLTPIQFNSIQLEYINWMYIYVPFPLNSSNMGRTSKDIKSYTPNHSDSK